jgi:hypothetical protein
MLAPRIDLYAHDDRHDACCCKFSRPGDRGHAQSGAHPCWIATPRPFRGLLAANCTTKRAKACANSLRKDAAHVSIMGAQPGASLDATIVPELELPIDAHRPSTPRAQPDGFTTLAS